MICACKFVSPHSPKSAAWHRAHRNHHLSVFPASNATTRASLDQLVTTFERGETRAEEQLS